jgi:replicative superfamily II helicase
VCRCCTAQAAYLTDEPLVISAPTGSGKTGVMELAILRCALASP